jgi:CPA2 family monovalent cation:H+ antiporter-2
MLDAHIFLKALAMVLGIAAVTTVLFHRLRQPVVLGYVLAGMIVGPYLPIPLYADRTVVQTLSELGVILLMFSLGLEFSLRKLVRVGGSAGLVMMIEVSVMLWLGYLTGRLLGFSTVESVFTGAIVSISSTMIIVKTFSEQRPERGYAELVFGVLVCEDLMAILLLAALTALSAGSLSATILLRTVGRLGAFLVALIGLGILLVPRLVRYIARLGSSETLLVACVGLCFAIALLAQYVGYSVALGAFICGSLVAESGESKKIEHLIQPVRDLFGAVFFVSVGMMIDPRLIAQYWLQGMILTAVVLGGKILGVTLGSFLTGHSLRISIQAAMTLAQIGEFSFIIAGVGIAQHATREFLYPVAVAISAVTALFTPILMRASVPLAAYVDRRLPRRLQMFVTLYGSWVEHLRAQPLGQRSPLRRLFLLVLLDDVALAGLAIGAALSADRLLPLLEQAGGLTPLLARIAITVVTLGLSVPLWIGLFGSARRLGIVLAARAIPPSQLDQADLGAAPRGALTLTLQILIVLLAGVPLLAVTQPFLPPLTEAVGILLWAALLSVLAVAFWRSTKNLLDHTHSGALAVIEALARQSAALPPTGESEPELAAPASGEPAVAAVKELLAGLGSLDTETLQPSDPCIGQTLAQLNLRGLTGATVLAIRRGEQGIAAPGALATLQAGDTLVLTGSAESLKAARRLLHQLPPAAVEGAYEFFAISAE